MQISLSHPLHTVFIKTPKGRDEVARRSFGLNPRQRRVLIVMDGTKNLSTMSEVIPKQELNEIISFLTKESFITLAEDQADARSSMPADPLPDRASEKEKTSLAANDPVLKAAPLPASFSSSSAMTLTQDAEKIREIKDFMTTTATTYLGLMAASLIHRIETAKEASTLMSTVGQWHMALRESKHGNRFATPYLEQVTAALSEKAS